MKIEETLLRVEKQCNENTKSLKKIDETLRHLVKYLIIENAEEINNG